MRPSRRGDRGPVAGVQRSLAHVLQRHRALGAHQAHRDLAAPHLEREEDRGEAVLDRGGPGEVERERRLTHRGSRGDDDHLAGMQSVGELVESREAGGDAGHLAVAAAGCFDLIDCGAHRDLERHVVLGGVRAGDAVDLGLCVVDEVERFALARVAHLHDACAGVDQAAQQRALRDDRGVVAGVRGRGHDRGERVQVVGAARALQLAGLDQFIGDGDDVRGLTVRVQREHGLEDELVLGNVEVHAAKRLDDVGDRILRQQHASERALLREHVVRRRALVLSTLPPRRSSEMSAIDICTSFTSSGHGKARFNRDRCEERTRSSTTRQNAAASLSSRFQQNTNRRHTSASTCRALIPRGPHPTLERGFPTCNSTCG